MNHLAVKDGNLIVSCEFEFRSIPKSVGGIWQPGSKTWKLAMTVQNIEYLVEHLPDLIVPSDIEKIVEERAEQESELEEIKRLAKEDTPITFKISGIKLPLYNYQKLGVRFAVANGKGVLIADQMGLGKCAISGCLSTTYGKLDIVELFDRYAGETSDDNWFDCKYDVSLLGVGESNNVVFQPVRRLYREHVDKASRIVFQDGSESLVGCNHGYFTNMGWKKASDLGVGDWVLSARSVDVPNPSSVSKELAEFLAWQIAEGHERGNGLSITQKDVSVLHRLSELFFGLGFKCTNRGGVPRLHIPNNDRSPSLNISSAEYKSFLESEFDYVFGNLSGEKCIPCEIQNATKDVVRVFLRAFFDAEGCCNRDNVELSSKSENVIRSIHHMLKRFGILGIIKNKDIYTPKWGTQKYWRINIGGSFARLFCNEIGFGDVEKSKKLSSLNKKKVNTNIGDSVPCKHLLEDLINLTGMSMCGLGIPGVYVTGKIHQNPSRSLVIDVIKRVESVLSGKFFPSANNKWKKKHDASRKLFQENREHIESVLSILKNMCSDELMWIMVSSVETKDYDGYVYDVEIDGEHNYFLDFVLTHNTLEGIGTAMYLRNKGVNNCLCIVPASLKFNWPLEIEKFTDAKYVVIDGSPEKRVQQWYGGLHCRWGTGRNGRKKLIYEKLPVGEKVLFYIVNYELVVQDLFGGKKVNIKSDDDPEVVVRKEKMAQKAQERSDKLKPIRDRMWDMIVADECMHGDTQIELADGSRKNISSIVCNKMPVEVLSYNIKTGKVEPKKVVGWFKNSVKQCYRLSVDGGISYPSSDHRYMTDEGYKEVSELSVGDEVCFLDRTGMSELQLDALSGTMLGDACIGYMDKKGTKGRRGRGRLRWTHGTKQEDYLKWKLQLFRGVFGEIKTTKNAGYGDKSVVARSKSFIANTKVQKFLVNGKKKISPEWLGLIGELGLALWYMDDGSVSVSNPSCRWERMCKLIDKIDNKRECLCGLGWRRLQGKMKEFGETLTDHQSRVCVGYLRGEDVSKYKKYSIAKPYARLHTQGFSFDENKTLVDFLQKRFGIDSNIVKTKRGNRFLYSINLTQKGTMRLFDLIAKYVPECMRYKLRSDYLVDEYDLNAESDSFDVSPRMSVSKIHEISKYKNPCSTYNIEVEDNHNYFAGNSLVANCHMLKTHSSKRTRSIKKLKAKFRMGLTGTPLDGRLEELHSVMGFVIPGLFESKSSFMQKHAVFDFWGRVIKYKGIPEIRERISPFFIRRLKEDVLKDLPDKVFENIHVCLSSEEARIYKEIAERAHELTEESEAMTAVIRCKQFCDHPELVDLSTKKCSKLEVFKDVVDEIVVQNGCKAVIFSQYARMNEILRKELDSLGLKHLYIWSGTHASDRASMQKEFNTNPKIDVMIGTDAMSMGFNFTAANYVINYDDFWSPSVMDQRADRCHRIGQKDTVTVVNFICQDTIEERIRDVLYNKAKVSSEALGDNTDEIVLKRLGTMDVAKLL